MIVTPDTIVTGVAPRDISVDLFRRTLADANSPAASSAGAAYVALGDYQVSIAFTLAVFHHESTYATNPAAIVVNYDTRNPGNCRSSRTGQGTVISTPRGPFVKYPNWVEGWRDLSFRLVDPSYAYVQQDRRTIRKIIELFAPASDGNAPDAYVNAVVADMNTWLGGAMPNTEPTAADLGVPVKTVAADDSVKGRYDPMPANAEATRAALNAIDWWIVHDTEGTYDTDVQYITKGHDASARAVIAPDGTVVLMVPLGEIAWTAGSSLYNLRGVNYEVSGFASKGYADAQYHSLAALMVWDYQHVTNPPPLQYMGRGGGRGTIGHQDIPNPTPPSDPDYCGPWGGHSCHADPGAKFDWPKLQREVDARLAAVNGQPPPADKLVIPGGFGFGFVFGFKSWVETIARARNPNDMNAGALSVIGYPTEDEWAGVDGNSYQRCERGTLQYNPNNQPPFDIVVLPCREKLPDPKAA